MYDINKFHPIHRDDLIRLGKDYDGGYIVSKEQVSRTEILLSFGINDDWSFEINFDKMKHIKIMAYDYSVSLRAGLEEIRYGIGYMLGGLLILKRSWIINSLRKIKGIIRNLRNLKGWFIQKQDRYFFSKYLNNYSDAKNTTFNKIFENLNEAKELSIFIKMDIEGTEYKVLPQLLPYFDKINGMAIEFHNLDKSNDLHDFEEVTQLLLTHFKVIHIHGNTNGGAIINTLLPTTPEITFMHKDMISKSIIKSKEKYPINGLDFPNNQEDLHDFVLPYNYADDIEKIILPYKQKD